MGALKVIGIVIALVTAPLWTGLYLAVILLIGAIAVYEQVPGWLAVACAIGGYLFCKWRHRDRPIDGW